MTTYVFRDGKMVDKKTGEPMVKPEYDSFPTPQVTRLMPDYQSPIDGAAITGRHARREDLKKHGCVPYEPSLSPTKGKVKNPKYARNGLQLMES